MIRGAAILVLAVLIGALFAVDFILAGMERSELGGEARRRFEEGSQLLASGHPEQALEALRSAHVTDRRNRSYQLKLAEALIAASKYDAASDELQDLLEANPNGGEANLLMARLMVRKGNINEAQAYYHRAIYGTWAGDGNERRLATRLELVKLIESTGNRTQLLAELLPLDAESPSDSATRLRIGGLYLAAGSPARAVEAYRAALQADRNNVAAYAGLGQAELASGDYPGAMSAFMTAYRRRPADQSIRKNIELAAAVTGLDPTPRRLSSAEKFNRATRILTLAREAMQSCATQHGEATTDDLGEADAVLAEGRPVHIANEIAEERLSLAETLWRDRLRLCGDSGPASDQPLRLIMEKLTQ